MKPFAWALWVGVSVLTLFQTGCQKQNRAEASVQLTQSFQQAEPEVKKAIETVNSSLKAGNVTEATRALAPVVTGRRMTQAQKDAVGAGSSRIASGRVTRR